MDWWKVLGVDRNADEETVRKAYRKLAMKHHPDKGGDPEEFKKIQEAYEIGTGKREPDGGTGGGPGPGVDPFSMFSDFFGAAASMRPRKTIHDIKLKLDVAFRGTEINLRVSDRDVCKKCRCSMCSGQGQIQLGPFGQLCPACGGKKADGCQSCSGRGYFDVNQSYVVKIKPGVADGTVIQVCEKFDVRVNVDPSPHFSGIVDGVHLVFPVKITFKESLVGKTFDIPHPGGTFEYRLNKVVIPGKKYTIPGKGLSPDGSLFLDFQIREYPETLTEEQIRLIERIL